MPYGAKGLAAMKPTPKAKKPTGSAKSRALKECVEALKDGDVEGAAAALGTAMKACMTEYEAEEDEG